MRPFFFIFYFSWLKCKNLLHIFIFLFLIWTECLLCIFWYYRVGCIASTRCHLVHWSINIVEVCKQNFTGIGKNPDFWPLDLIFGFCWWWSFSGLIRLWTGQHLSLQRHFFFYQGEGFYSNQGLPRIFTRVHKGNGNNCRVKPQDCWCQHSCVLLCSICEQCLDFRIGWCEFEGKRKKMHVISDIS